ncbi:MAG TPA: acylphosphatase [Ilumatobacteraceae bacterium]
MIRVRAVVEGRVQGVWYRESCRREAVAESVAGWVRNNEDGSVEAVLEGEAHAVARVLAWMRTGPPSAIVTNVRVTEEEPRHEQGFKVR